MEVVCGIHILMKYWCNQDVPKSLEINISKHITKVLWDCIFSTFDSCFWSLTSSLARCYGCHSGSTVVTSFTISQWGIYWLAIAVGLFLPAVTTSWSHGWNKQMPQDSGSPIFAAFVYVSTNSWHVEVASNLTSWVRKKWIPTRLKEGCSKV